jgi:hypothetical protein
MGTRSIWTFTDMGYTPPQEMHVYKHWDGYPAGAVMFIVNTFASGRVWKLPRWEADEFGAGFIATNKEGAGDCRLATSRHQASDVAFGYTLWAGQNGSLVIRVVSTNYWDEPKETLVFEGLLATFVRDFAVEEDGKSYVDKEKLADVLKQLQGMNKRK